MKNAYSNLLGEHVNAREVDREDIIGFQIVCPICREPIFKVSRTSGDAHIHFFSHFKSTDPIVAEECERRVASMPIEKRGEQNRAARNKTLEMFRSVVRQAVSVIPIGGRLYSEADIHANAPMYAEFARYVEFVAAKHVEVGFLDTAVARNDASISTVGYVNLTDFGAAYRSRIAADLLRTIFANKSQKTVSYMVGRAFHTVFEATGRKPDGSHGFKTVGRAAKLLEAGMANSEFNDHTLEDVSPVIHGHILLDAMLRELQRLPHLRMIENAREGRPPLHGITLNDYLYDHEDEERLTFKGKRLVWDGPLDADYE